MRVRANLGGGGIDLLNPAFTDEQTATSAKPLTIATTQKPKYFIASCIRADIGYPLLLVVDYSQNLGYYIHTDGTLRTCDAAYISQFFPASDTGISFYLWTFMGGNSPKTLYSVYY